MESEAVQRQAIEDEQRDIMRWLTVKVGNASKAARKFARHGMLILKCSAKRVHCFDMAAIQAIAAECAELETRICTRLRELGVQYSGFSEMGKQDVARLLEDERLRSFKFAEVSSRCLGRLDIKLPVDLVDRYLGPACSAPPWQEAVEAILGGRDECKLAYCGLISSFPGSFHQPFHGDGPHLFGNSLQVPPHAVNVFVPLHEITEELGPTEFFPGSHSLDAAAAVGRALSSFISLKQTTSLEILSKCRQHGVVPLQPLLTPGRDVLLYDYRTVHRGTGNRSQATTRRMLYLLYAKPWFGDHINFGNASLFAAEATASLLAQQQHNTSDAGSCAGHINM